VPDVQCLTLFAEAHRKRRIRSVVLGFHHSVVGAGLGRYQPWRCLWRGSEQITMTRPCRRITLHLSQMGLTLGFTFTAGSILFL
jgi:hypothetical protein